MTRRIKLTQGRCALVDDTDFEWLNQWKWFSDATGYASRDQHIKMDGKKEIKKRIYMHRLIMNFPEDKEVDHINHDKSDNRRINLRICTRAQNTMNHEVHKNNTSGHKGVHWDKSRKKWLAFAVLSGKFKYLGRFMNKEDAVRAREDFARANFGEYA